ncbi:LolA family protein [Cochlodiniinecator piscidefendens]|uniref:LolA family protein n=1 Tax=Cochlodiniinecator piscidefendens TaxID=2715756 RepID=UPI00140D9AC1|nr:outer membrane lipoprotein carrier protein LolA [Cochlodiniinecator piscidefendens]
MTMFRILFAPVMTLAMTIPAAADVIPLSEISRYLNDLRTARGEFTQINDDGSIATGGIFIHRPGRIRFEYSADETLVIAGGGQVAIFDGKSNTGPEQYPLARTPLNLLLERNVDLGRANMVVGHGEEGPATTVTLQDPENPEYGSIKLVFTAEPTQLRQWVTTNDGGGATTVILGDMETDVRIGSRLFNIPLEVESRSDG